VSNEKVGIITDDEVEIHGSPMMKKCVDVGDSDDET
jgi:hypothetical protein